MPCYLPLWPDPHVSAGQRRFLPSVIELNLHLCDEAARGSESTWGQVSIFSQFNDDDDDDDGDLIEGVVVVFVVVVGLEHGDDGDVMEGVVVVVAVMAWRGGTGDWNGT